MVKERVSYKYFAALRKKWPTKAVLDRDNINMEELLILEFLRNELLQPHLSLHI